MKISYSWLKEYLDIDVPAKDLAEKKSNGVPLKLILLKSPAMV